VSARLIKIKYITIRVEKVASPITALQELGPHLTQCCSGRPSCQVASWSIEPFGHNRYGPKIWGLCPLREGSWVPI